MSQSPDNSSKDTPDSDSASERVWEEGWEGHEQMQRERMARLTLAQKLQWLEEAQRLAEILTQQRKSTREDSAAGSSENRLPR